MAEEETKGYKSVVAVLLAGTFLAVLNQTLLTPALPTIMRDLGVGQTTVQWLTSGYSLVEAVVIPMAAWLMGRFRTRRLFCGALVLFAAGSALAALAPVFGLLLLGRLLQACCTGLLLPLATSLILLAFPKDRRGSAMGLVGLIVGFAPAIGPVVSGLLIDGIGWRALFAIVFVLAAIVIACGVRTLEDANDFPRSAFDASSVALSSVGMVCFLYGLSTVASSQTPALPIVLLGVGAALITLFVLRQLVLDEPMLDVRILATRDYRVSVIAIALIQAGFLGMQVIMPLYIQDVRGYSPTLSGLALMPGALLGAFAAVLGGMLFDKRGIRAAAIPGGIVALMGAVGIFSFGTGTPYAAIVLVYLVLSVGLMFAMTPINTWGVNSLPNSVVQHAQSLSNTFNQVAGSFSTALLVSLASFGSGLASGGGADAADSATVLMAGYHVSFAASAVIFVLFFLTVLLFVKSPGRSVPSSEGEVGADAVGEKARLAEPRLLDAVRADVFSLPETATVADALACMAENHTSGLPIVAKDGSVVGFVSDGDILRALSRAMNSSASMYYLYLSWRQGEDLSEGLDYIERTPVIDIATRYVVTLDADAEIAEALKLLSETRVKKVPVLRDGKMAGVLSRSDLVRYLSRQIADGKTRG